MTIYKENEIEEIAFEIKNNKTCLLLTDTIYGFISIDKSNIYKIKNRSKSKKIIQYIPNISYLPKINEEIQKLINAFWPGPLTLIINKKSYRIPKDEFLLKILSKTGPLYTSSANISGQDTIKSLNDGIKIFDKFSNKIIFVERNVTTRNINQKYSTIFDTSNNRIIREGDISEYEIRKIIR